MNRELVHLHHHHALFVEVHRLTVEAVADGQENAGHAKTLHARVVRDAERVIEWDVLQVSEADENVSTWKEIHAAKKVIRLDPKWSFFNHSPTRQINIRLLPERVQDVWSSLRCRFLDLDGVDDDAWECQLLCSVRVQLRLVQLENVVDVSVDAIKDRITHGSRRI